MLFYPHADDENVAMGYANYNHKEEDDMVTINEKAFRTYMFANYLSKLEQGELLELLEESIDIESLVDMARSVWELPFDLSEGKVELIDPDALLLRHSEPESEYSEPIVANLPSDPISWEDEEDYDIISDEDDDDDEYVPYDEYDENLEEIEDEEA